MRAHPRLNRSPTSFAKSRRTLSVWRSPGCGRSAPKETSTLRRCWLLLRNWMSQVRRRFPTAWQRVGGHLSAFAELLPQLTNAEDHSFLIARTRLVGRIKNFVIERTANASAAALKAFFD